MWIQTTQVILTDALNKIYPIIPKLLIYMYYVISFHIVVKHITSHVPNKSENCISINFLVELCEKKRKINRMGWTGLYLEKPISLGIGLFIK